MSNIKHFLRSLPALLWYGLIWQMSAQTATSSGQSSGSLMGNLFSTFLADYRSADDLVQHGVRELVSFFIRKGAHMFLFFVLAILIWYGLGELLQKRSLRALTSAVLCAVLAAVDEFHQTFVPGRSGEVRDVFVDLSGALIALLLFALPVISLRLRRALRHPERFWLVGIGCGMLLMLYVAFHTSPAPLFVARAAFSPLFIAMTAEDGAALLTQSAPILRQILYLFASAASALLSTCLAVLSGNWKAVAAAMGAAICLSLAAGLIWSLPLFSGLILGIAGCVAALILWAFFPLLRK